MAEASSPPPPETLLEETAPSTASSPPEEGISPQTAVVDELEELARPALPSVEAAAQELHRQALASGPALSLAHDVFNTDSHALHVQQGVEDLKDAEVGIKHDRVGKTFGMLAAYKQELMRKAMLEQEEQARAYLRKRRVMRLVRKVAANLLLRIGRVPGDLLGADDGALGVARPSLPNANSADAGTDAMLALLAASTPQSPEPVLPLPLSDNDHDDGDDHSTPSQRTSGSGRSGPQEAAGPSTPATPRDAPDGSPQQGTQPPPEATPTAATGEGQVHGEQDPPGGVQEEASNAWTHHGTSAAYDSTAESQAEDDGTGAPACLGPAAPAPSHPAPKADDDTGGARAGARGRTAAPAAPRRPRAPWGAPSGGGAAGGPGGAAGVRKSTVWQKDGTPEEINVLHYDLPAPPAAPWPPPYVKLDPAAAAAASGSGETIASPWRVMPGGWNFSNGVLCSKPSSGDSGGGRRPGSPTRPVGGRQAGSPPHRPAGGGAPPPGRVMQLRSALLLAGELGEGEAPTGSDTHPAGVGDGEEVAAEQGGEGVEVGMVSDPRVFLQVVASSYVSPRRSRSSSANGGAALETAGAGDAGRASSPPRTHRGDGSSPPGVGEQRPGTSPRARQRSVSPRAGGGHRVGGDSPGAPAVGTKHAGVAASRNGTPSSPSRPPRPPAPHAASPADATLMALALERKHSGGGGGAGGPAAAAGAAGRLPPPPAPRPPSVPAAAAPHALSGPSRSQDSALAPLTGAARPARSITALADGLRHSAQADTAAAAALGPWRSQHAAAGGSASSAPPSMLALAAASASTPGSTAVAHGGSSISSSAVTLGVTGAGLSRPASQQQLQRGSGPPAARPGVVSRSAHTLLQRSAEGMAAAHGGDEAAGPGSSGGGAVAPMAVCGSPVSAAGAARQRLLLAHPHAPENAASLALAVTGSGGCSRSGSPAPASATPPRAARPAAAAGRLVGPQATGGGAKPAGTGVLPVLVKPASSVGGLGSRPGTRGGAGGVSSDAAPPSFSFLKVL